jgi:hypothetical protein
MNTLYGTKRYCVYDDDGRITSIQILPASPLLLQMQQRIHNLIEVSNDVKTDTHYVDVTAQTVIEKKQNPVTVNTTVTTTGAKNPVVVTNIPLRSRVRIKVYSGKYAAYAHTFVATTTSLELEFDYAATHLLMVNKSVEYTDASILIQVVEE